MNYKQSHEPWLEISDEGLQLEGLIFDREHNLFLCEVFGGKIFKVNLPSKDISVAFQSEKQNPVKFIKMDDCLHVT